MDGFETKPGFGTIAARPIDFDFARTDRAALVINDYRFVSHGARTIPDVPFIKRRAEPTFDNRNRGDKYELKVTEHLAEDPAASPPER